MSYRHLEIITLFQSQHLIKVSTFRVYQQCEVVRIRMNSISRHKISHSGPS